MKRSKPQDWVIHEACHDMHSSAAAPSRSRTSTLQSARPGLRDTMLLRGSPTYEDPGSQFAKAGRSAAFGARLAAFVRALMPEVT
jgi:hypothetical protein